MRFLVQMTWRSLRRTGGVTIVMVACLAIGVATWYVQHQIFAFLASKRPAALAGVHDVALERAPATIEGTRPQLAVPLASALLLTSRDAAGVLAGSARHAITFAAPALLEPGDGSAETVQVRYATADLFALFEIPIVAGTAWTDASDGGGMLDERIARRWFGSPEAALGRTLLVGGERVRIVGVVGADERARYHLYERFVALPDDVYLPLARGRDVEATFRHELAGGEAGVATAWVELPTPAARAAFVDRAAAWLAAERATGRAGVPRAVTLRSADEMRRLFDPGGTLNLWPLLGAMCIATCVVNLVRMLMVKFAGRRHDLGLLRAFGARRRAVMGQLLFEAVAIGLAAGVLGVALGVALLPLAAHTLAGTPAMLAGAPIALEATACLAGITTSIAAALVAALYPAWLLARGTPATQLGRS